MDDSGESRAGESRTPAGLQPSTRVRLARAVRAAALGAEGVVGLDTGPAGMFVTAGGGETVPGVSCVSAPDGGYDVTLQLVCRMVALQAVGERVREAVEAAAAGAGIDVASITVRITDVDERTA